MTTTQLIQWALVAIVGVFGFIGGYYGLELFTRKRIRWALICSTGWVLVNAAIIYGQLFPDFPDKKGVIIRFLLFADRFDREDGLQMAAYVVVIWCLIAMPVNTWLRRSEAKGS